MQNHGNPKEGLKTFYQGKCHKDFYFPEGARGPWQMNKGWNVLYRESNK